MRHVFLLIIAAVFILIGIIYAALQWARREPRRKFPDGVHVTFYGEDYIVLWAYYHRGRWWYHLDGLPFDVKQGDLA